MNTGAPPPPSFPFSSFPLPLFSPPPPPITAPSFPLEIGPLYSSYGSGGAL